MSLDKQFVKFNFMFLVQSSLFYKIHYSIQSSNVLIFGRFKPVVSVVQGFQLVSGTNGANILLPGCSFIEKKTVFLGFKGNLKFSEKTQPLLGRAREDWRVLNSLCLLLGKTFSFNEKFFPENAFSDRLFSFKKKASLFFQPKLNPLVSRRGFFYKSVVLPFVTDFYKTDSMSILSKNLALCGRYAKCL